MKIVYTGPLRAGDTCELRRRALERLGHETIAVDLLPFVERGGGLGRKLQWHLRTGALVRDYNAAILSALDRRPDVLWVDKGVFVRPALLEQARARGVRWLVHYSPDNYLLRQNSSRHLWRGLPHYDVVVTTKRSNVMLLSTAGARRVLLSGNAFDPDLHRPIELSDADRAAFGCDVSFIGRWEPDRERLLEAIVALPIRLRVRGPGWERVRSRLLKPVCEARPLYGDDYVKAIAAAKINLGLLSIVAGDAITQRSIEIPACGAFMLAERTGEHRLHFADGEEAVFFEGSADLVQKVREYLADDAARERIAIAGRARCVVSGYTYDDRLREILASLEGATPTERSAAA
jgi:spore maturation protein CgeB